MYIESRPAIVNITGYELMHYNNTLSTAVEYLVYIQ